MEVRTMIKKALVALLSSAILATTVMSGVVATPTVAYAEETKVIKITENDCISKDDLEQRGIDLEGVDNCVDILKASDSETYFLVLSEYREDGLVVYQLDGSAVIETNERRYTVSYDGTSYNVTDVVNLEAEAEEKEKAKVNKWISDMVICKHPSAGNVTLSASEKKGTLTVNKADIKAATKLDMMLKSKKTITIKVKASSKSKAVKQLERLQKLIGHANTYGVQFWTMMFSPNSKYADGFPSDYSDEDDKAYKNYIRSSQLKKSGSFYSIDIHKLISQNYTYLCKAYDNAFKRAKKRNTGYDFVEGTHLCDCSDIAKLQMISEIVTFTHEHAAEGDGGRFDSPITKEFPWEDDFKVLASNKHYAVYDCGGLRDLSSTIGQASGFPFKFDSVPGHGWSVFNVKDSSGKKIKAHIDNGVLGWNSKATGSCLLNNNDRRAMTHILGHYVLGGRDVPVR